MKYQEPILSIFVLDYAKPIESRLCLESVKRHVKVPYKVIFVDNGSGEDYSLQFLKEGLVDQLIINRDSTGLGIGTRDGMNACFGQVALMLQNDQLFIKDFLMPEFISLVTNFGATTEDGKKVGSINLAGNVAPEGVYSERAHLISTRFYKDMERNNILGYAGAGPYHDAGPWREAQIQELYARENLIHWTPPAMPWVRDNGVYALRDMKEGGVFLHRTDTKQVWVIVPPTGDKNPMYPKMTEEEFSMCKRGEWMDGRIPSLERQDSFNCWGSTELAQMELIYVSDLRERFAKKKRS